MLLVQMDYYYEYKSLNLVYKLKTCIVFDYGHEFLPPLTSYVPPNATISTYQCQTLTML